MGRFLTNEEVIEEVIRITDQYSAHHYKRHPLVLDSGYGCLLVDKAGQPYLDMVAGYSAVIFGRSGKYYNRLLDASNRQARKLALVTGGYYTEPYALFCKKLAKFCGMDMVLAMNSGAEAVETAMKIAKRWAYEVKKIPKNSVPQIISCCNNFHGRTQGVLSLSDNDLYRKDFGPFLPGCVSIPFGNIDALARTINKDTAAFIVEPIQGEGGINIPPENYLRQVERVCREKNVLLAFDEIQTGFGRTGSMFACQQYGIKPDLIAVGKAISGGLLPISAVGGKKGVMELFDPGSHGSTFGGNPLACAVACEVMDILNEDPSFIDRAREIGKYFLGELKKIVSPAIKEVRGRGLLVGIELNRASHDADYCYGKLLEEGIMCGIAHEHVLRFSPPLIITKAEIDWALPKITKVLQETRQVQ